MLEGARLLAGFSVILLILAIAAATSPLGRLQLRRLDLTTAVDDRHLHLAAYLLMAAVGSSGVAAFLALMGWLG